MQAAVHAGILSDVRAVTLCCCHDAGFKREDGITAVKDGKADAVVYGRYFISNPGACVQELCRHVGREQQ
jgi:2,4-dienoyl-CoA reductase-like NADH-dependent reductase (Old Yellow Enzyme family)